MFRVCLSLPRTLLQQRSPRHRLRGQIPSTLKFLLGSFLAAGGLGYFWMHSAGVFFSCFIAGMNKELSSLPAQRQPSALAAPTRAVCPLLSLLFRPGMSSHEWGQLMNCSLYEPETQESLFLSPAFKSDLFSPKGQQPSVLTRGLSCSLDFLLIPAGSRTETSGLHKCFSS